jgi:acyl-CoA synthetase (AMP-forming)/AMP-acid ligase II
VASPKRVLPWLSQERIEVVHAVPGLATHWAAAGRMTDLPWLRWTLFAGEPLYDTHVRDWLAIAPHTRILNLYGPSETTLAKFWHRVGPEPASGLQPVGRPLPGTMLRQLPLELTTAGRRSAADGVIGNESFRVEISTPHGSLGYLENSVPGVTGRLRRLGGVTIFTTEDRGRLDNQGKLFIEGRLDSLVKRRGIFVDCGRIERAARSCPDVAAACCIQVHADGSGDLVLFVEQSRAADEQRSEADLRRLLWQQLGRDVPDRLVRLPALPTLPNGKLDRRELLRQAQDGAS